MIVAVRHQHLPFHWLGFYTDGLEVLSGSLYHRFHMMIILPVSKCLRIDDHLMLIDQCLGIESLDSPVRGLHEAGFVIGDIALDLLPPETHTYIVLFQELPDPLRLLLQTLNLFLSTIMVNIPFLILPDLTVHQLGYLLLQLSLLFTQRLMGSAPFFGGDRGKLATVQGKGGSAEKPRLLTDQQDIPEQRTRLFLHR